MTLAVTGASGFIGSRLVARLRGEGRPVRCLVRASSRTAELAALGAELAVVDLESGAGLDAALEGIEGVVHVAGAVRAWDRAGFERANVDLTRRVASAARERGVRRFVALSSLAAAGPSAREGALSEDLAPRPICDYGRSKLAAERALAQAAGSELAYSVVRPCVVYGPGDRDVLQLFRLAARGAGVVPYAAPPGVRLSMVHVDDLVELTMLALERAPSGAVYFCSDGGAYTWDEIVRAIGVALDRRVRPLRVPPAALWPAALGAELLRPFRSRPPVLCADKLRQARQPGWVCSPERARRELGYAPRHALAEGLELTARWYRDAGWL